jgi:hypothetical protein
VHQAGNEIIVFQEMLLSSSTTIYRACWVRYIPYLVACHPQLCISSPSFAQPVSAILPLTTDIRDKSGIGAGKTLGVDRIAAL